MQPLLSLARRTQRELAIDHAREKLKPQQCTLGGLENGLLRLGHLPPPFILMRLISQSTPHPASHICGTLNFKALQSVHLLDCINTVLPEVMSP